MKKIIMISLLFFARQAICQQSFSSNFISDVKSIYRNENVYKSYKKQIDSVYNIVKNRSDSKSILESLGMTNRSIESIRREKRKFQKEYRKNISLDLPVFGISGIGNVNQESLNSLNASGKISVYARPVQFRNNAVTVYASYNKNASNNDSVIYNKLIFPEIGNSSFTGTLQFDKFWKHDLFTGHALGSFFEFAVKKIVTDSTVNNQKLYFTSLTYTAGFKYTYGYSRVNMNDSTKMTNLSFFAIPYISVLNIPNEDTSDYKALLLRNVKLSSAANTLTDNIFTWGIKIGFQINNLQVFADFRSVLNSDKKVPIRELQGFHSNIGIIFNAEVFEFRR